jgi:tetratricopeptide (TPR) repeat protein
MLPSTAQNHLTYGHRLIQQGRFAEAWQILEPLHQKNPKNLDVLFWLAIAARNLQQWQRAIVLLQTACAAAPQHLAFREQLAMVMMLSNDAHYTAAALEQYQSILQQSPQSAECAYNLMIMALRGDYPDTIVQSLPAVLACPELSAEHRLSFSAGLAIATYLTGDFERCAIYVNHALALRFHAFDGEGKPKPSDLPFLVIYAEYLRDLLAYQAAHPAWYRAVDESDKALHFIGESHCLTPAHLVITEGSHHFRIHSHLQMGAMAFYFTHPDATQWQTTLRQVIQRIPADAPLVLCFGEIDCRPEGHLMRYLTEKGVEFLSDKLDALITPYTAFMRDAVQERSSLTRLCGVPAPSQVAKKHLKPEQEWLFTQLIATFNQKLKAAAAHNGLGFVDVYAASVGEQGWAKPDAHIDPVHLTPCCVAGALRKAVFSTAK